MDFLNGIFISGSSGDVIDPGFNGGIIAIYEKAVNFVIGLLRELLKALHCEV